MLIKFVGLKRNVTLCYPFPNDRPWEHGWGVIEPTDYDERTILLGDKEGNKHKYRSAGMMMSEYIVGKAYRFFGYTEHDGINHTMAWDPDEYQVFIQNDDGKTVDRL